MIHTSVKHCVPHQTSPHYPSQQQQCASWRECEHECELERECAWTCKVKQVSVWRAWLDASIVTAINRFFSANAASVRLYTLSNTARSCLKLSICSLNRLLLASVSLNFTSACSITHKSEQTARTLTQYPLTSVWKVDLGTLHFHAQAIQGDGVQKQPRMQAEPSLNSQNESTNQQHGPSKHGCTLCPTTRCDNRSAPV